MSSPKRVTPKEPYGSDIEYADPGFRKDGIKRYPLDTPEHVRAAASYFGAAKNRDEYTAEQRAHIQDLIDAAKKRHNIGDEDASVKTAPSDTYEDSSALDNAYAQTSPMSISNDDADGLDDGAFAVVQGGEERAAAGTKPSIRVRSLPLYESNKHHYSGIPHKGLIKAALAGIGPDKDGKRPYPQAVHSEALRRVRNAHQQLTGDYSMALSPEEIARIADPLERDIANLKLEIASKETTLADRDRLHAEALALKDAEIASLTAKVQEHEAKANEQAALVVANERLATLSKVDGFTVADTEKAALIEVLAKESEDQFKNRLLGEENASLKRKIAAGGAAPDPKDLALHEEHAGLRALSGAPVKIAADSAHAALFA